MREIGEIELAVQGGTEKIEQLGEQGKVEESMKELAAVEALKAEKAEKEVISFFSDVYLDLNSLVAGTAKSHRDLGRVWSSKAPRLRCLWGILERTR